MDSGWTTENLVPLFDWERDARAAAQAWHGFLTWGRWNKPLLAVLLPYMKQTFAHRGADLEPHRRSMCERLASMALHSDVHPLKDGWLTRFIADADEESRVHWANAVGRQLKAMDVDAVCAIW